MSASNRSHAGSSRSRRGFTLVEVMISVALSVVVLLLAFSAFRVAAQSISHLNRLETENELLRTGITQAVDDADFWNPEANPEFPYGRAYAAFQNVDAAGNRLPDAPPNAVYNHGNNKRPFRRVEIVAGSAEDINWMQPHDPRSWYRNMVYSNARPLQPDYINGRYITGASNGEHFLWEVSGHPQTNWRLAGTGNNSSVRVPPSWTPRHLWGDYAEIANPGYTPSSNPNDESSYRGARAVLMEGLFREMGAIGVVNYLPPGCMTMYLRPSTNLYNGSAFNDPNTHYDKGEIPWQLDRPKILNQDNGWAPDAAKAGKWDSTVERPSSSQVPQSNRLHYMEALQIWQAMTVRDWVCANRMRGLVYGVRVGDGNWPWATVNALARQGWSSRDFISDQSPYGTTTLLSWEASQSAEGNRNDTYLVPVNLTGDPNPMTGDRAPTLPLLRVSNFRYRYYGGDICNLAVRVEQPGTGRVIDLGFSVLGTTFRGARQHWALRTWGQRIGMASNMLEAGDPAKPAMGDYYR